MLKPFRQKQTHSLRLSRSKFGFWTKMALRFIGKRNNPYKINSYGGTRWQQLADDSSCRA